MFTPGTMSKSNQTPTAQSPRGEWAMELQHHHDIHVISKLHDRYSHEQKPKADMDETHWNSMDRKKRKETTPLVPVSTSLLLPAQLIQLARLRQYIILGYYVPLLPWAFPTLEQLLGH